MEYITAASHLWNWLIGDDGMPERKGFMHAVEGVIAAMTLLAYFYTANLPPLQTNDWTHNSFKQASTEFLEALNRANLSEIFAANTDSFSGITSQLFETSDVSIVRRGLPSDFIRVGIVTNHSREPVIYFNGPFMNNDTCILSYGWYTEFGCTLNDSNIFLKNLTLADTDIGKVFDKVFIYDSLYVDKNDNDRYDTGEGPFYTNSYVNISGNAYYVGYIDNSTKSVALWNATPMIKHSERMPLAEINGRSTALLLYGADLSGDVSQFDVLLISGPINLTPYAVKLEGFLRAGKGIVEVANLTDENYNQVQSDLFGLVNGSYDVIGSSTQVRVSMEEASLGEPIKTGDYFSGISMRVYMSPYASPPYDVTGLPNPAGVLAGFLNVSGNVINVAVANSSPVYDSFYIDTNGDYNFSNPPQDTWRYREGDSFTLASGNYTVKRISPLGFYADIKPHWNVTLANFFNPLKIDAGRDSWAGAVQDNAYNISTNSINGTFAVDLGPAPVLGNPATLPSGVHTYGNITPANSNISGTIYNISLTNNSAFILLNIDLNRDQRYDGYGEGPFAEKELFAIGPEIYRGAFRADGTRATFQLISRKRVPAAIAGDKYSGRTVWMPDVTGGGHDSWNYIAASVIWASPKKGDIEKISNYQNLVSSRKVFIASGDMYQPYIVELYRGYK